MTADSEAKELVNKFIPCVPGWDCYHDSPRDEVDVLTDAKRCAQIALDFLIENSPVDSTNYWINVKTEIEKL